MHRAFVFLVFLFLSACSYHNTLPSHLYQGTPKSTQINARVLIPSDKIAQKYFLFKDYHEKSSVHSYQIDLTKGSLIAAADALATVFKTVEVNPSKQAEKYQFIAEVNYQISDGKNDSAESVQWLNYTQMPYLETHVQITFYTPLGEEIFVGYATRRNRIELNNSTAVAKRAEDAGTTLLLPLTAPVYTQQMGDRLRYTLARDLADCLQEIVDSLPINDFQERKNYVK